MSIRPELLRPGDLLFYRPKAPLPGSWFITWAQNVVGKSPIHGVSYNHVALVDWDTKFLLESRWPKSRKWKIDWKKLHKYYYVELWRVRNVEPIEVKRALNWAHKHLGEWYDLSLFLYGMFDQPHREVCSTYVAKAWAAAGRFFVSHKTIGRYEFHSPDELAANTHIIKKIEVSEPIKDLQTKG